MSPAFEWSGGCAWDRRRHRRHGIGLRGGTLRRARLPAHGKSLLLELALIGLERALHQRLEIPARQAVTRKASHSFQQLAKLGVGREMDPKAVG
jgi:hypothetical protein